MKFMSAVGAALLASSTLSQAAFATEAVRGDNTLHASLFATEHGETLPPVGYVRFCAAHPAECVKPAKVLFTAESRVVMTPKRWNTLYQVNSYVNRKIKPVTDQELYGEPERWTYPVTAGDCEDFLLLKKRKLEGLGFSSESLRITVVLDERNEGHAVLTVTTNEGDFILDNRRNDILLWNDTNYTFLKRQSEDDPRRWMALLKKPEITAELKTARP